MVKYTQKQGFILREPAFFLPEGGLRLAEGGPEAEQGGDGDGAPAAFQDHKGPVPDEDAGVAGETGSNDIEQDVGEAVLRQETEEIEEVSDEDEGDSKGADDDR